MNGYEETRSREEGAVKIAPVQPVQPATSSTSSTTGLNTDAIIAQVTEAKVDLLQPIIPRFWPPSDQQSRRLSPSLSRADKSCLSLWQKVLSTNIFNAQPAFCLILFPLGLYPFRNNKNKRIGVMKISIHLRFHPGLFQLVWLRATSSAQVEW